MHNHIRINKKDFLRVRKVKGRLGRCAASRWTQGLFAAGRARIDIRDPLNHLGRKDAHGALKALLEKRHRGRPTLVYESIKDMPGETRPDVLALFPAVFLEIGSKVGVVKPENTEISLVLEIVLAETGALQVLRIHPIHVCVRIPRVTCPPIYFAPIYRPQVRDDIQVGLGNVAPGIAIDEARHKLTEHY